MGSIRQVDENGLAHRPDGPYPSGNTAHDFLGFQRFLVSGSEGFHHLRHGMGVVIAVGIDLHPARFQCLKLFPSNPFLIQLFFHKRPMIAQRLGGGNHPAHSRNVLVPKGSTAIGSGEGFRRLTGCPHPSAGGPASGCRLQACRRRKVSTKYVKKAVEIIVEILLT